MFPVLGDFFSNLWNSNTVESYKKNDDYHNTNNSEDISIQLLETNTVEDFIEETREYYRNALGGRDIKYVSELKFGLGRVGDGIESELLWWTPVEHPVGAMLQYNQLDPICSCSYKHCGTLLIYPDVHVQMCIDEIAQMLKQHRNINLVQSEEERKIQSDQEKEASTKGKEPEKKED